MRSLQPQHMDAYSENALAWEEYWRWDEDDTVAAGYSRCKLGKSCGYMVYLIKDDMMHIKEMIYLTREAHEGLWEYIRAARFND